MDKRKNKPKLLNVDIQELVGLVERVKVAPLNTDDHQKLKAAMETLVFLLAELKDKKLSIDRLRQILFGAKTEKTSQVLKENKESSKGRESEGEKQKRPGHGRNRAAAYLGAERIQVPILKMNTGENCPECIKGKVYPLSEPAQLVRITGVAPLSATVYECDRLRCNLCGEVYTAEAPEGVGEEKYDESATAMVGLVKYGTGLPFNRLEKLQSGMGIPLPASTQWDLVKEGAEKLAPVYDELVRQGAQGDVLYNDDTAMKILDLTPEVRKAAAIEEKEEWDGRTGVFTTGIISTKDSRHLALFFTGAQHAGENLSDVLAKRAADLPAPIQMCDALSRNVPDEFETLLASCNSHARREFVELVEDFPEECRRVLETFRDVYKNDAHTKREKMSAEERLQFHRAQSGPLMAELENWLKKQIDEHLVEPNSGLGEAIRYMQNHWSKLTLFLRVPGAPLDNNICERAIKKAILHRKNALFYKTLNGARVGDIFMSLIHTAELNGIAPFDWLVAILRHHALAAQRPSLWMPWNYTETLAHQQIDDSGAVSSLGD